MKAGNPLRVMMVPPDGLLMGGVQVRCLMLASRLGKHGVFPSLLLPGLSCGSPVMEAAHQEAVTVYGMPTAYRLRRVRGLATLWHDVRYALVFPLEVWRAVSLMRREGCHVVHVNGLLNLVPAVAARFARKKLVWHLIGDHYPRSLVRLLMPLVRTLAHKRVYVAAGMLEHYGEKPSDPGLEIIPEPVIIPGQPPDLASLWCDFAREAALPRALSHRPTKVVAGVGHLVPAKNWERFLAVARVLLRQIPELHFVILGSPSPTQEGYAARLKRRCAEMKLGERVFWCGYVKHASRFMPLFDMLLCTSRQEGTPLVILEAMASGVPVVSTRAGAVADVIQDGQTGWLTDVDDAQGLARACAQVLQRPEPMRHVVEAARRFVVQYHGVEQCLNAHLQLYQSLFCD